MKVQVKFRCGHSDMVRLYGTEEEVSQQANAMEEYCLCPECSLTKFSELPYITFERALEQSGTMNLPPLKGSFGQIRWATTIRLQLCEMSNETLFFLFNQENKVLCGIPKYNNILSCFDYSRMGAAPIWELFIVQLAEQQDATWYIAGQKHCARELINAKLRQMCDELIARRNRSKQPESASAQDALAEIPKEDIIVLENIPEIDRGLFPSDKPSPDPADGMPPNESQEELPKSMPPQTFKKKRHKNKSKAKRKK